METEILNSKPSGCLCGIGDYFLQWMNTRLMLWCPVHPHMLLITVFNHFCPQSLDSHLKEELSLVEQRFPHDRCALRCQQQSLQVFWDDRNLPFPGGNKCWYVTDIKGIRAELNTNVESTITQMSFVWDAWGILQGSAWMCSPCILEKVPQSTWEGRSRCLQRSSQPLVLCWDRWLDSGTQMWTFRCH